MRKIVGYTRVSTVDQEIDTQRARLLAWVGPGGARIDPADLFEDDGISGRRVDNRPGLAAALGVACGPPGGVLVVYSLSRMARSIRDTLAIADRLEAAGADLVSLSEQVDTTTAAGKMFFRLMAVLAEFERDLIAERTRAALARLRARGERLGQLPYGLRLAGDGVTVEPDPAEAEVLALMRRLAAEGDSRRAIARELNRLGIPAKNAGPTRSGRAHETASGRWSKTSVGRILERYGMN